MNHYSEFTYPMYDDINSVPGTMRGFSTLPKEFQIVSINQQPPSPRQHLQVAERRPATAPNKRVDRAISNFRIEFDNGQKYQPGSDVKGRVLMDVWSAIDVRYVEFVIQGKTTIRQFREGSTSNSISAHRPKTEVHLNKKILLLSPQNGQASLILTPGKYVSSFLYKLPQNIPPTVEQTELGDGYTFNITYTAQANICDFLRTKNESQREKYAQVVKSTKRPFNVVSELDYQSLPGALDPITHAEQFNFAIKWFKADPTSILVKLNHQVYTVGDTLSLHLEIYTPRPDRIGQITAEFEQKIIMKGDSPKQLRRIIVRALDDPRERKYRSRGRGRSDSSKVKNMYKTGFQIPIPRNMIPSLLPCSKLIDVRYSIQVQVKLTRLGGSIHLNMPVTIAPTMDPEVLESQKSNIPLFNKPVMQFPYFAKSPLRDSSHSLKSAGTSSASNESFKQFMSRQNSGTGKKAKRKHEKVRVTYKNCFGF